ncbi:hypothetical protein DFH06DRAFT_692295 [Mycena polygramma]|nr:hypothetical protein DFH06DRAFT_692295 [Mycena polygramma]
MTISRRRRCQIDFLTDFTAFSTAFSPLRNIWVFRPSSQHRTMPDPISAATTFITLATFIKDLLDLGQSIRRSIEKTRANGRLIRALADDIVAILAALCELTAGRESNFLAPPLLRALGDLKADMLYAHAVIESLVPTARRKHGIRGLGSHFRNWLRRDDVGMVIQDLKDHINKCYIQFTAFSAARTEYTTVRVEQAMLIHGVENSVKLLRLEGMIAELLLNTPFGNNIMHQAADAISSKDSTHETLEFKYLSVQTMRLVDFLQKRVATHAFGFETPIWDATMAMEIRFLQPTSAMHVLQNVIGMVVHTQDDFSADDIADDLLTLGSSLSMLGLYKEALASDVLTVQLLRCLATGDDLAAVLPRLIFSLCNLSKRHRHQLRHDVALQTSQQAVFLARHLSDLAPNVDNSGVALTATIAQAHDQCTIGRLEDAISTAEQATAICRPILARVLSVYPFNVGLQKVSPEDEWRGVKCYEAFFELARAHSLAGSYVSAHRALKKGLGTVIAFAGSIPPPTDSNIDLIFNHLFRMASGGILSLTALADVIKSYHELGRIYQEQFTLPFLPVLYAHAHLGDWEMSSGAGVLIGAPSDSRHHVWNESTALADNCSKITVMEDAIRAVYASPSRPQEVHSISPLIEHFFIHQFNLTHMVLRNVTKSLINTPACDPSILAFAIAKISDTLSPVYLPHQMVHQHDEFMLGNLAELVTSFRMIVGMSQKHRDFFLYALWQYCWGLWLVGRLEEALDITHQAIELIRSSHKTTAELVLNDWIPDQVFMLFELGRIADAHNLLDTIAASDEEDNERAFCGFVHSHILRRMGKHQEALLVLTHIRGAGQLEGNILAADIAMVELNLNESQSAAACAEKTVIACRASLAEMTGSEEAQASLTYALTIFSDCLVAVGRHAEALSASEEAVDLALSLNELSGNWPSVVRLQELKARALHAFSLRLVSSARLEEGLRIAKDATVLYRELVELAPRHLPSFAASLQNLASILWSTRQVEAIAACEEAIKIIRRVAGNECYFLPSLHDAVQQLSTYVADTDSEGKSADLSETPMGLLPRECPEDKKMQVEVLTGCQNSAVRPPRARLPEGLGYHLMWMILWVFVVFLASNRKCVGECM